ncbi:unnamed protein product [Closterium sp. NIES-53]
MRNQEGAAGHGRVVVLWATTGPTEGSAKATMTGVRNGVRSVQSQKKQLDAPGSRVKESYAVIDVAHESATKVGARLVVATAPTQRHSEVAGLETTHAPRLETQVSARAAGKGPRPVQCGSARGEYRVGWLIPGKVTGTGGAAGTNLYGSVCFCAVLCVGEFRVGRLIPSGATWATWGSARATRAAAHAFKRAAARAAMQADARGCSCGCVRVTRAVVRAAMRAAMAACGYGGAAGTGGSAVHGGKMGDGWGAGQTTGDGWGSGHS